METSTQAYILVHAEHVRYDLHVLGGRDSRPGRPTDGEYHLSVLQVKLVRFVRGQLAGKLTNF
jgi:hypothetical protein